MKNNREKILLVDDVEENVLLIKHLLQKDYKIVTALGGEQALELAEKNPVPDLILLDIMMPDKNGYVVIRKLKTNRMTRNIPVIFLTAMGDIQDETKGLALGAADYIIKPIKPPILKARVRTQIQLRRAQNHIQNLYDATITGLIELLTDILSSVSPAAFDRSARLRLLMSKMLKELGLDGYWEFDLAAMLSQIGCVTLETSVLEDIYSGKTVGDSEYQFFRQHPLVGKRLIENIPYLEDISSIIGGQRNSINNIWLNAQRENKNIDPRELDKITLGTLLLSIADKVEEYARATKSTDDAFKLASRDLAPINDHLSKMLDNLSSTDKSIKALQVYELAPGMVLERDLYTRSGSLLLNGGTPISQTVLERIKAFENGVGLVKPVIISLGE